MAKEAHHSKRTARFPLLPLHPQFEHGPGLLHDGPVPGGADGLFGCVALVALCGRWVVLELGSLRLVEIWHGCNDAKKYLGGNMFDNVFSYKYDPSAWDHVCVKVTYKDRLSRTISTSSRATR